jgi:FMN-dependent NADH-azoreductase
MNNRLHRVAVSPRGAASWSRRALELFTEQHVNTFPDTEVTTRECYDLPHISHEALLAGRTDISQHTPDEASAFALQDAIVTEVEHCSHLVIATPMYNWSTPSALKAWVDHFVNRRTFYGAPSVLAGKKITVIISSGGLYSEGPQAPNDTLRPWFANFFARLGADEYVFIDCDPTGPMDFGGLDENDPSSAWSKAQGQIAERIAQLHS